MTRAPLSNLRGFYAIVDPDYCQGRDPVRVARAILDGGCAAMQLRAKNLSDQALVLLGKELTALCREAKALFFLNDRPDIALVVGADGVHLGQDDMSLEDARLVVRDKLIGISTHSPEQADRAAAEGADLIGYGPVFQTHTKKASAPTVGLQGLAAVCRRAQTPVVAIGGITLETISGVINAGAPLVAAIRAVCSAPDPGQAARQLHLEVLRGRKIQRA
jgi:thiamine-phosphate pyrophosphorylase